MAQATNVKTGAKATMAGILGGQAKAVLFT